MALLVFMFPFVWTIIMASNTYGGHLPLPAEVHASAAQFDDNVRHVLDNVAFFQSMANTAIVAISTTLLVLFFDSLAAFTFAKFRFPGRNVLFVVLLATMLLPAQLAAVPQFQTMALLGWVGSLKALIIPGAANAFGIFWMRQYFQNSIHDELVEAATLDGCGFFGHRTGTSRCRRPGPALAFLGIFTFVASWNDYMWPLIVLTNPDHLTLQVALSTLNRSHGVDYSMVMTGALMAMVPAGRSSSRSSPASSSRVRRKAPYGLMRTAIAIRALPNAPVRKSPAEWPSVQAGIAPTMPITE